MTCWLPLNVKNLGIYGRSSCNAASTTDDGCRHVAAKSIYRCILCIVMYGSGWYSDGNSFSAFNKYFFARDKISDFLYPALQMQTVEKMCQRNAFLKSCQLPSKNAAEQKQAFFVHHMIRVYDLVVREKLVLN